MPRANYGFRGDALTPAQAIEAGATVTSLDYGYAAQLGVVTPLVAPGQVTGLTATAGSGQLALAWTAPSAGSSAITGYQVSLTPSGGDTTIVSTGSTAASYTATSLTNDTAYSVAVRAVNGSVGEGDFSSSTTATPTGGTPVITITQQPQTAAASNGSGSFSVTATVTGGGTLTYQWQRCPALQSNYTNISGATSATYARTQMVPYDNYLYFYRCVVSCTGATSVTSNSAGWSSGSTWYGIFNNPDAAFTSIFGSVSATSGSASWKLSTSLNGWDGPATVRVSNAGTLRITGTLSGDDVLVVSNYLNNAAYGPGDSNGYTNQSVNMSIAVTAGDVITMSGSYLDGTLQMWIA